jgi:hypothetical protein
MRLFRLFRLGVGHEPLDYPQSELCPQGHLPLTYLPHVGGFSFALMRKFFALLTTTGIMAWLLRHLEAPWRGCVWEPVRRRGAW